MACFVVDGLSVVDSWILLNCVACSVAARVVYAIEMPKDETIFLIQRGNGHCLPCSALQHPTNGRSSDVPPLNTDPKTRDAPSCTSRLGIGTGNGIMGDDEVMPNQSHIRVLGRQRGVFCAPQPQAGVTLSCQNCPTSTCTLPWTQSRAAEHSYIG